MPVGADMNSGWLRFIQKPWYIFLVCLLAAVDLFVGIIPTDGLVISLSLAKPRRWIISGLAVSLGSLAGALALAWVGEHQGLWILEKFFGDFQTSAGWIKAEQMIQDYGAWAVFIGSVGPLPTQPFVLIAGLGQVALAPFVGFYLAGRLLKYLVLGWITVRTPQLLRRLGFLTSELDKLGLGIPEDSRENKRTS